MACSSCSATMQSFGRLENGDIIYWCPRCGTIRRREYREFVTTAGPAIPFETDEAPRLVERTRYLLQTLGPNWTALAHQLGVLEACMTPEQRKELHDIKGS